MNGLVMIVIFFLEFLGLLEMILIWIEEDYLEVIWKIFFCNMWLVFVVVDYYVLFFCSILDCMSENIWMWIFVRLYFIIINGKVKVVWFMKC